MTYIFIFGVSVCVCVCICDLWIQIFLHLVSIQMRFDMMEENSIELEDA